MWDVEALLDHARTLKTRVKNLRDRGRYGEAVTIINELIERLEEFRSKCEDPADQAKVVSELSDCCGLLGGVERRWGLAQGDGQARTEHLEELVKAYDKGRELERAMRSTRLDTYNMVNSIIGRILLRPKCLSNSVPSPVGPADVIDVTAELGRIADVLAEQSRADRRGDVWALADLALVKLLLGRDEPVAAYAEFVRQNPPTYAYESALSTLRPLAELDLSVRERLQEAIVHLERCIPR